MARRRSFSPVRMLTLAGRGRLLVFAMLALLAVDLASSGICCADSAAASDETSLASVDPASPRPDTPHGLDDNCFCCAHSVGVPSDIDGAVESLILPSSLALDVPPIPALPELYHPPQSRA